MAERMVAHFGTDILAIIEQDPGRLIEVHGLGPKRTKKIAEAWEEQKAIKEVMMFLSGVGVGLWRPKPGGWGALRLTTTGRRTGRPRQVVVGYFEDGRNLITMAMNGWGVAEPAWWLNLQAHPDATAQTRDGARQVRARRAQGDERERLWSRWAEIDKNLDAYAARRPTETAVVVLEPRNTVSPASSEGGA